MYLGKCIFLNVECHIMFILNFLYRYCVLFTVAVQIQMVSAGVLMNRKLFYFSLLSLSITACSSVSNKQAHGDFDYANKDEAKALTIPEGLLTPKENQDFYVPEVANSNAPIGEEMDIRAPSLVIPIAAASRIEGNDGEAQVWFDQVIDSKDLLEFIRNAVKSQLANDGVALNAVGSDNKVFESDWYNSDKEAGFWFFKEVEETEGMRFKYTLDTKPHGRSVAIKVDLIDYTKTDLSGSTTSTTSTTSINSIDKHRAEMVMLNTLIGEVDYQYRIYKHKLLQSKANQKIVSLGNNAKNDAAYIVDMDMDSLWTNIPTFFSENGFEVTDLNESKHIYFVDYLKLETGFWGSIWSDDKPILELANGKYQFVLSEVNETTAVTLLNEEGEALSSETLETLLPVIQSGFSFKSLF